LPRPLPPGPCTLFALFTLVLTDAIAIAGMRAGPWRGISKIGPEHRTTSRWNLCEHARSPRRNLRNALYFLPRPRRGEVGQLRKPGRSNADGRVCYRSGGRQTKYCLVESG
jgi:hypothetical protein